MIKVAISSVFLTVLTGCVTFTPLRVNESVTIPHEMAMSVCQQVFATTEAHLDHRVVGVELWRSQGRLIGLTCELAVSGYNRDAGSSKSFAVGLGDLQAPGVMELRAYLAQQGLSQDRMGPQL